MLTSDEFVVMRKKQKNHLEPAHKHREIEELNCRTVTRKFPYIHLLSSAETENDVSTTVHDVNLLISSILLVYENHVTRKHYIEHCIDSITSFVTKKHPQSENRTDSSTKTEQLFGK